MPVVPAFVPVCVSAMPGLRRRIVPCRYSFVISPPEVLTLSSGADTVESTYIAYGASRRLGGPLKVARPPGSPSAALATFWGDEMQLCYVDESGTAERLTKADRDQRRLGRAVQQRVGAELSDPWHFPQIPLGSRTNASEKGARAGSPLPARQKRPASSDGRRGVGGWMVVRAGHQRPCVVLPVARRGRRQR